MRTYDRDPDESFVHVKPARSGSRVPPHVISAKVTGWADVLGGAGILRIQRDAGNRAVARLLTSTVQVQRTVEPKPRSLTLAESRARQRDIDLADTMSRWRRSYTQKTREAADSLNRAMENREVYAESLQLGDDAEKRIESMTDNYFDQLKKELEKKPQDDPNQEGNVLGIWRLWNAAFSNRLEIEQLRQSATDSAEPEEPGDYPRPENPLDMPQGEGEEETSSA